MGLLLMYASCAIFLWLSVVPQPKPYFLRPSQTVSWGIYGPTPIVIDSRGRWWSRYIRDLNIPSTGVCLKLYAERQPVDAKFQPIDLSEWMGAAEDPPDMQGVKMCSVSVVRVGYPFRALQYRIDTKVMTDGTSNTNVIGGVRVSGRYVPWILASGYFDVPYLPYWPGFFYNILAWSGVAWVGKRLVHDRLKLAYKKKRAKRRKLSLCLSCGYPIGDIRRCPECGEETEMSVSDVA